MLDLQTAFAAALAADKSPETFAVLAYAWVVVLSIAGGIVAYTQKIRTGVIKRFSVAELIGEMFTAGFVGVITFLLCESLGVPQLLTAAMVGIAGHMGSRLLFMLENVGTKWINKKLGVSTEPEPAKEPV